MPNRFSLSNVISLAIVSYDSQFARRSYILCICYVLHSCTPVGCVTALDPGLSFWVVCNDLMGLRPFKMMWVKVETHKLG